MRTSKKTALVLMAVGYILVWCGIADAADADDISALLQRIEAAEAKLQELDKLRAEVADLKQKLKEAEEKRVATDMETIRKVAEDVVDEKQKPLLLTNVSAPLSNKVKIGGEVRVRGERPANYDMNERIRDNDDFALLRTRINIDADVNKNLRAFVQIQDSRVWGSEASTAANFANLDLRQGYFDFRKLWDKDITLRAGRQVLSYGDQRLIGGFEWNNVGRAFDALKFMSRSDKFDLDVFSSTTTEGTTADEDAHFSGIYTTWKGIPNTEVDTYILNRRNSNGATVGENGQASDIKAYTAGMRIKGKAGAIDYSAEVPYQFGEWGTDDLSALAAHADMGYTFVDHPWKPRVGAEYSYSSGDRNPTDGKRQTFDNLFPTNHLHYGYMDLFSWRNIRHLGFAASAKPTKKLLAKANFHIFGLDDAKDAWYNAGGRVLRRSATGHVSRDVGKELDLTLKYKVNQNVSFLTGYSHFFAGDFVRDTSATGERDDADWVYFMVDTKF